MNETYIQLRERQRNEMNEFPIVFAFDNKQFEEAMKKLNAKPSECVSLMGVGDFMKKTDAPRFKALCDKQKKELREAMKDTKFAEEAFRYEMDNHEFAINSTGIEDVLACFGFGSLNEVNEAGLYEAWRLAEKSHMKYFEELGVI